MADDKNLQGFRQTYQETGKLSSGGGPGEKNIDAGPSGSSRNNNWKIGAKQAKLRNAGKIGPGKNLKDIDGGNFYWCLGRKNPPFCISKSMKDFISEIIGRVKTERSNLADTVTAGINVNTFEDYQRLVGRYEGFDIVLQIIEDILTEDDEE